MFINLIENTRCREKVFYNIHTEYGTTTSRKLRHKWERIIRNFKGIRWMGVSRIHVAKGSEEHQPLMKLETPQNARNCIPRRAAQLVHRHSYEVFRLRSTHHHTKKTKLNSVALVREQTIPTERPPPVGEVSANFCGQRGVTWSAQRIPTAVLISVLQTGAATFYSSSSSIDLTRLSGPRYRPTTTQKIWQHRESNPRPLYLQPETVTTRPQRRSTHHHTLVHNLTDYTL